MAPPPTKSLPPAVISEKPNAQDLGQSVLARHLVNNNHIVMIRAHTPFSLATGTNFCADIF
jgi:hypothetical protein